MRALLAPCSLHLYPSCRHTRTHTRTHRELATQLRRDIKPRLDEAGVTLLLVSVGTLERATQYVEETQFPADSLFLDPSAASYAALGLAKNPLVTFASLETPLAIKQRFDSGRSSDLQAVLPRWAAVQSRGVWLTPEPDQVRGTGTGPGCRAWGKGLHQPQPCACT